MNALVAFARLLFRRFSLCAHVGANIGVFAGFIMAYLQALHPQGLMLTPLQVVGWAVLIAIVGGFFLFVILAFWVHYDWQTIALPLLVNSLITSLLTVVVTDFLAFPALAMLVGFLLGLLIGTVLCWFCHRRPTHA